MRAALRRTRPGSSDPWSAYLAGVEPALAAQPRLHRFARPPVLGDAGMRPLPLAVWIDGERDGDAATRTRTALQAGTVAPSVLLDGPLQAALAGTRSERVVLVRAGDEPAPLALERLGQAAALASDAAIITCDDDELSPTGERHSPRFAPGPSPDHWLACDDSGPLLVVERQRAAAGLSKLAGGEAWRHELALVLAGPGGDDHAHVPMLLCHRGSGAPVPPPLTPSAVARALAAWEPGARVEQAGAVRRIRRAPAREPSVEVIVCFRDRPELLARCLVSILARTDYERLQLALVDNGSVTPETAALVTGLARQPRVRMLRDPRPFNFAALNNAAAESSHAEVLVFLNNDTEVIDGGWVAALLEEALRPDVGAVAPLLLFPDGTVQHAGAALGLHGYAGHPFAGLRPDDETAFGWAAGGTRNWLAVTAACMMVERAKFIAAGGFDDAFVVAGNDVDLCLRLTSAGQRSLCVPHTSLVHDESRSRGAHIDPGDFAASEHSYGAFRTVGDPFYNPNLTLRATTCGVRQPGEELP
jgi:GT2 family glycosyltransferase